MIPAWQGLIGSLEALHCHLVAEPLRTDLLSDRMSPTGSSLQQEREWVHQPNGLWNDRREESSVSPLDYRKALKLMPTQEITMEIQQTRTRAKWLLCITSYEVKHISLSVRELYYTADFSAEIRFKRSSSFSLCGFQRHVNLDKSASIAGKLSRTLIIIRGVQWQPSSFSCSSSLGKNLLNYFSNKAHINTWESNKRSFVGLRGLPINILQRHTLSECT